MIDCSSTFDYLHEFNRRCDRLKKDNCRECIFYVENNCEYGTFREADPMLCIKTVQDWCNENPEQTRLSVFDTFYPEAKRNKNGIPYICVDTLGMVNYCSDELFDPRSDRCKRCWNTPVESYRQVKNTSV